MISTLDQLRDITQQWAIDGPSFPGRKEALQEPGESEQALAHAEMQLGPLPKRYRQCIQRFALKNLTLGLFGLWPGGIQGDSLVDDLIRANDVARNPYLASARSLSLLKVACFEADPIFVVQAGANWDVGSVFLVSHDDLGSDAVTVERRAQYLASGFDQLLLVLGNLLDVERLQASSPDAQFTDFMRRLDVLGLHAVDTWRQIAEDTFQVY